MSLPSLTVPQCIFQELHSPASNKDLNSSVALTKGGLLLFSCLSRCGAQTSPPCFVSSTYLLSVAVPFVFFVSALVLHDLIHECCLFIIWWWLKLQKLLYHSRQKDKGRERTKEQIGFLLLLSSHQTPFLEITLFYSCSIGHPHLKEEGWWWLLFRHQVLSNSFATSRTIAHQTPLSMGFCMQTIGVGCHALLQEIFPTQEQASVSLTDMWILLPLNRTRGTPKGEV